METNIYGGTLAVQEVRFHTSPAVDTYSNPDYGTNLTHYRVVYIYTMYLHIYMCLTESLCCKEDIHTML